MLQSGPAVLQPPRIARLDVERVRIAAWFAQTAHAGVRLVCAPVGTGKTVAVKQYAAAGGGRVAYTHVPFGADYAALRAVVDGRGRAEEVVLDEVDRADPAAFAQLVDDIADGALDVPLVLVGRSRRRLHAHALIARGLATACDAALLAFDAAEIARLADAFGVAYDEHDVAQVLHDAEGWPVATQWLVRDAAEQHRSLRDAFLHWRDRNGHLLLEFIEHERYEEAEAFEAFRAVLASDAGEHAAPDLERLEQLGLPLLRSRAGVRPYRILLRTAAPCEMPAPERASVVLPPLMMLNVLGRFRCEIGGNAVIFARRRDQHVFTYVAIAPDGRASRERLLDAFWPGVDRRIAAQGLRTTLSRIRRAIAEAAPGVDPDRYFHTAGELRLDFTTIGIDVRRFVDQVEQGRLEDARGALDAAKHHYRAAQRAYADRLLASEAPEPCFERFAQAFERLYVEALTRLTELYAAQGEFETARQYARDLIACNTDEARRRAMTSFAGPMLVPVPAATA